MGLVDDVEVSSYTVVEDNHALAIAVVGIKEGRSSHHDTDEEDMLATSSKGCDSLEDDGSIGLAGEADRIDGGPSKVDVEDRIG